MFTPVDIFTLVLSILAIVVSTTTFLVQERRTRLENQPICKVSVPSIGDTIKIVFDNAGIGVMKVIEISYSNDKEKYDINLSKYFDGIPCKKRTEERLNNQYVSSSCGTNLFTCTLSTQENLVSAWEVISLLNVKIVYEDIYKKRRTDIIALKYEYDVFIAALGDRRLEAFDTVD